VREILVVLHILRLVTGHTAQFPVMGKGF
jgi:hypothetical protein